SRRSVSRKSRQGSRAERARRSAAPAEVRSRQCRGGSKAARSHGANQSLECRIAATAQGFDAGDARQYAACQRPRRQPSGAPPRPLQHLPYPLVVEGLYRFLRRPLPGPQARELLKSKAFASLRDASYPTAFLGWSCLVIAALTPPALRSELQTAFSHLPPDEA